MIAGDATTSWAYAGATFRSENTFDAWVAQLNKTSPFLRAEDTPHPQQTYQSNTLSSKNAAAETGMHTETFVYYIDGTDDNYLLRVAVVEVGAKWFVSDYFATSA